MIPKQTLVRVKTTNGGEAVAELLENYRGTYDAVISVGSSAAHYAVIPSYRIVSVEIVEGAAS
jgi:hypothetical protein